MERLGKGASQQNLQDYLYQEMDARALVPSFVRNGYLPYEPMVVREEGKGSFRVIEGNRRLSALRALSTSRDLQEQAAFRSKNLDRVPCLVFRGDASTELAYLGLRHISKTKDWSAEAKAGFIERVLREGHTVQEAASMTNSTPHALRQMLLVRHLLHRARELGLPSSVQGGEGEVLFWQLGDAVRRRNTKRYIDVVEADNPLEEPSVHEGKLQNLFTWIFGNPAQGVRPLTVSIRDIPRLDACLGNQHATRALEDGRSLEEAEEEAAAAGATVVSHLDRARKSVQRATGPVSDVHLDGRGEVRAARDALRAALDTFDRAFGSQP